MLVTNIVTNCRRWIPGGAGLAALWLSAASAAAQTPVDVVPPRPGQPATRDAARQLMDDDTSVLPPYVPLDAPSLFPLTPYADQPHPGDPLAPSVGQPHFDDRAWRYGHWYRPKSAVLTPWVRCVCPDPFRPRGYGNLFARPCTPYRMEYDPYLIEDARNQYGPSYVPNHPNQFCSSHRHWRR